MLGFLSVTAVTVICVVRRGRWAPPKRSSFFIFEISCHSRSVGPRFRALPGATPRESLAAFLWPRGRPPGPFRGSPPGWQRRRRAGHLLHRGSGVGSEQTGHCSWQPLLFSGRIRNFVLLLSTGGRLRGVFVLFLIVFDQLMKAFDGRFTDL